MVHHLHSEGLRNRGACPLLGGPWGALPVSEEVCAQPFVHSGFHRGEKEVRVVVCTVGFRVETSGTLETGFLMFSDF